MHQSRILQGACDTHVHFAPDIVPRARTAVQLAYDAASAGMRAILLKNHYAPTYLCAHAVDEIIPGIRVFGGLVLNASSGGLNAEAVFAALRMGAREIWMPTVSAQNHIRYFHEEQSSRAVPVFDSTGRPVPGLIQILTMIAQADAILGTGHIAPQETVALTSLARSIGVRKILITHPEFQAVAMNISTQATLADQGAFFERCYNTLLCGIPGQGKSMAEIIRYVGTESTVLASDMGQMGNTEPSHALLRFYEILAQHGITETDADLMLRRNPAYLLGLEN